MRELFAELRRRNVFRVGAAYAVVAWLLIEISDTVFPRLGLPEWTVTFVIVVLLLGFPVALFMAWAFELTPEGVKRTAHVHVDDSNAREGGRGLDWLIVIGLVVVIAFMAAERLPFPGRQGADPAVAAGTSDPATGEQRSSIAVLAFDNMSPDPANAYFAEGISEEILNILAGVDGLHVASRTSAFSFRGKGTPIPQIARELNVLHVLEGSVRKQGNRVRITAQLIRADTDGHLWSQAYDRDLVDIFKVQEEIAQAITGALGEVLGMQRVSVQAPTADLDAYERFLRGRALFHRRAELATAITDLGYAVEQDPRFGEAWVYLAAANFVAPGYDVTAFDHGAMFHAAQAGIERARVLLPEHPMVLGLQGMMLREMGRPEAVELLQRASRLSAQDSTPIMWYGLVLYISGYLEEALVVLRRAAEMDPMVGINHGYLGMALLSLGRELEAQASLQRARELDWGAGVWIYAIELAARGERERALAILRELHATPSPYESPLAAFIMALQSPDRDDAVLEQQDPGRPPEEWIALGMQDRFLGRLQEMALSGRLHNQPGWLRTAWLPSSGPIREDPRFFVVADVLGFVKLWEVRGYPPGCRRVTLPAGDRLDCAGIAR
jgi:adenylate cyclase